MLKELCIPTGLDLSIYSGYQYGSKIGNINDILEKGNNYPKIALITEGEDVESYDSFRKSLYEMSANFDKGQFVDLGAVKGGSHGITEVVDFLQQKNIFSIVIGKSDLMPLALMRAYSTVNKPLHLSLCESRIDYDWQQSDDKKYLLDHLIPYYPEVLSRLNYLGYQSYFVDDKVLELLEMMHFEAHRIGVLRNNISEVEPIVRDSDIFGINLSSISYNDCPATLKVNPNGFMASEACQIVRYAGMSDRLSCLGIYGYAPLEDHKNLTALLIAQMVWYNVNGLNQRKNEYPLNPVEMTRYEVTLNVGTIPVAFFKSERSERWWFYVEPTSKTSKLDPERLVSCSYEDYLKTCSGEIPDRLLNAMGRE